MPKRSKWAEPSDAGDSIRKAAEATLTSRLASVAHFLPLAANYADESMEYVHQLRVCTRRSLAALSMYERQLGRRQEKWFRKRLRRIRKAAGDARDLDVFLDRYQGCRDHGFKKLLRQIRKQRRAAQQPIAALNRRLICSGQFAKHTERLLESLSHLDERESEALQPWVRAKVADVYARFIASVPEQSDDLEALHRFRIRGKALRYTMELSAGQFPPEFRESVYPLVTRLQTKLGEINDHASARQRLLRWSAEAKDRRDVDLFCSLTAREHKQLKKSIKRFSKWWRPEFVKQLDDSFQEMLSDDCDQGGCSPKSAN